MFESVTVWLQHLFTILCSLFKKAGGKVSKHTGIHQGFTQLKSSVFC